MKRPFLPTPATPLRQRMIEDMNLRGFQDKTQRSYIRIISAFAPYMGLSPETATPVDVRQHQIYLSQAGVPIAAMNARVAALRFLFTTTLDRPDLSRRLIRVFHPHKLPSVLSPDEVGALLSATTYLKHRSALSVAYGAGYDHGQSSCWPCVSCLSYFGVCSWTSSWLFTATASCTSSVIRPT
jgi:integrase/recombinase XerD